MATLVTMAISSYTHLSMSMNIILALAGEVYCNASAELSNGSDLATFVAPKPHPRPLALPVLTVCWNVLVSLLLQPAASPPLSIHCCHQLPHLAHHTPNIHTKASANC